MLAGWSIFAFNIQFLHAWTLHHHYICDHITWVVCVGTFWKLFVKRWCLRALLKKNKNLIAVRAGNGPSLHTTHQTVFISLIKEKLDEINCQSIDVEDKKDIQVCGNTNRSCSEMPSIHNCSVRQVQIFQTYHQIIYIVYIALRPEWTVGFLTCYTDWPNCFKMMAFPIERWVTNRGSVLTEP